MTNEEQARQFLDYINAHYDELRRSNENHANAKLGGFDEDVYSDTILKVYDKIMKRGIKDNSPNGYANYLFKSYKINQKREKQYARNAKNDDNVEQDEINGLYDKVYNAQNDSTKQKLLKDLKVDYSTIYILKMVEHNFDPERYYLFRLKTLIGYTYKQLAEKTKIPSARTKVLEVYQWLRENITKEEIDNAFYDDFQDLIDFD